MSAEIRVTQIRVPFKTFRIRANPLIHYKIYFGNIAPPPALGQAGDYFVELSSRPQLFVKAHGTLHPNKIAWRWAHTLGQVFHHPLIPDLYASATPHGRIPTWATEDEYNGDLRGAAKVFVKIYGPGGLKPQPRP